MQFSQNKIFKIVEGKRKKKDYLTPKGCILSTVLLRELIALLLVKINQSSLIIIKD